MTVQIMPMDSSPLPIPEAGIGALSTPEGNLSLDSVDVHAAITGLAAHVEVTQGFRNPFEVPVEATYVFPLPDRAAVTGLRMEAADRVVTARLKERMEAREEYDQAIASGQRAAIAEEDRPDVFTMRVGNILPGERVTVRLTLDQPLPYEDGAATFRFPLVVAPRYIPGAPLGGPPAGDGVLPDTTAVPDASRISPPVLLPGFPNPVTLSITADIDPAGLQLGPVASSLHTVTVDGDTVRLTPGERLDRDFLLRLPYTASSEDPASPGAVGLVESLILVPDVSSDTSPDASPGTSSDASSEVSPDASGEGTFTLTLVPGTAGSGRPKDVVLVIDRSGSMDGWKMVAARRAAARIIDSLQAHDRFAVLSFDHAIERPKLPSGLVEASDRNRFRAVEHLARLEARGGTEMLRPLTDAVGLLGGSARSARDGVLVLVTDGQVGNEDQILAALSPSTLDGIRVHTVGIDQAVNAGFLGRLAAYGLGRCELVESEDRLDAAMEHIHHRIATPVLTEISLHPEGGLELLADTLSPARPPSLFPGVPLVISGRYRGDGPLTITATLPGSPAASSLPNSPAASSPPGSSGASTLSSSSEADSEAVSGSTPGEWRRTLTGRVAENPATAAIWARAHLRDLEDSYAVHPTDELEQRLVSTSLRHGVLCRFTAFVAVDSRVVTSGDAPHKVIQPVEIPQGWQPAESAAMPLAAGLPAPAPMMAAPAPAGPPVGALPPTARSRASASGGAAPSRFLPRPAIFQSPIGGGGGQLPPSPEPESTPLLELELSRLKALADAPAEERLRHLSDLVTRLESLSLPELATLLEELKTSPDPLSLWPRLIEALTSLAKPRKRPFWKR